MVAGGFGHSQGKNNRKKLGSEGFYSWHGVWVGHTALTLLFLKTCGLFFVFFQSAANILTIVIEVLNISKTIST
jgi:hypothetical protein